MATTGPVNGTLIAIYKDVAGTLKKIANATSNSIDISKDMIDVTSKDSAGAKEFIAGEYGYTLNVEAIFEDYSSVGASQKSFKDLGYQRFSIFSLPKMLMASIARIQTSKVKLLHHTITCYMLYYY